MKWATHLTPLIYGIAHNRNKDVFFQKQIPPKKAKIVFLSESRVTTTLKVSET